MLSLNCKNVQHVKIYLPCNFEVNPSTHFDRLCKLEKRGDEIKKKSSPLKLLSQSQPNFAEMILRWSPFKIVSVSAVLYPRWPPLLKIEISSNGQNCSIVSQKVPKFELYKHNDELFNIYSVKEIRKLKSQDSRTSECLRFTGPNRISLVRQKNLKREIRWNHFDHNKQMMQVYISIFIL